MNMDSLEDDNLEVFQGGTLEMKQELWRMSCGNSPEAITSPESKDNERNANIDNRTTGVWGGTNLIELPKRISETLWSCKNNNQPPLATNETDNNSTNTSSSTNVINDNAHDYFIFRDGVIEHAVQDCVDNLINSADDGDLIGTFLLTEITLWDAEKERLVLVTEHSIYNIKYDFIALKCLEHRRIASDNLDTIVMGDLVYPPASLVPARKCLGVRLQWNNGVPINFTQRWNPFSNDIPFVTFASHPLYRHSGAAESLDSDQLATFSVEEFGRILMRKAAAIVQNRDIVLQSYVGLGSLIYNRNALGFFKVRGKFSF